VRILPSWLREFVPIGVDDRQLAEDLTSAGIAVESVAEENGATVYEMDLTTNRVDAMNHYGVAREASAIYDVELKPVAPRLPGTADPSTPAAKNAPPPVGMTREKVANAGAPGSGMTAGAGLFPIVIEDPRGCARYTARIVRDVKIGPSPEHIINRLELLGSRSINNVADATNYALNELGHPTHAFDLDLLEGGTIIVRRARAGEVLKTLDGVERKLTPDDLVIADAKKPVALAGVMGGFDTMITERTRNVLIESAWFDPAIVRATAKRLGMHTDASHRFERGADWGITPLACDRVAELILQSAGGRLDGDRIDAIAREPQRPPIVLRASEVKRILGVEMNADEIQRIFRRLGFGIQPGQTADPSARAEALGRDDRSKGGASVSYQVTVPTWRLDVEREIDLLEELARIYGYNKFPNTLPSFTGAVVELPHEAMQARVRQTMLSLGYDEAISITFVSGPEAQTFGKTHPSKGSLGGAPAPESGAPDSFTPDSPALAPLAIANPLSEEAGYLRPSLVPGLLNMVGYNLNRGNADLGLFEWGEIFEQRGNAHDERRHLAFAATGNTTSADVHGKAEPYNFFHMKGDIEQLLAAFRHKTLSFEAGAPQFFHPGRSAQALMDGECVAHFGQLHPDIAAARKLRQDVFVAEVFLDRLFRHGLREPRYRRISKFPAVERDFSFVFADALSFQDIRSRVEKLGIAELVRLEPAEIYRGENTGAGQYSLLLRAAFQSQERTLRDDEVAQWSAQIISALEGLGGVLRA
jgi:phenylalanyl-tRNA synthetase beta chain